MSFKSFAALACVLALIGCGSKSTEQTPVPELTTLQGEVIAAAALDDFLLAQMKERQIPGLSIAVISGGEVTYLRNLGVVHVGTREPVGAKTIFEAASVSKAVFAYFVMILVEEGTLDLDRPLYEYLPHPDLEQDMRYQSITARMALSHQSGLPNWRFLTEDGQLSIEFDPGTDFGYSGEAYEYLVSVVAHLTGESPRTLETVFQERVAEPLGMRYSSFTRNEHWNSYKAYGHHLGEVEENRWYTDLSVFGGAHSFHTNAEDLSKFAIALIEGRGLQPESFEEMLSEQVVLKDDEPIREYFGIESWTLGFGRVSTPWGMQYAHGGVNEHGNAYFMVIPEAEYGLVFLANSSNSLELAEELERFLGL